MKQTEGENPRTARQALGRELRAMHQMSGRTLRAVEREISVSDSTLSRYFRGQAVPSWPTVEKICAALGGDPQGVRPLWTAASAEKSGTPRSGAPSAVGGAAAASADPAPAAAGPLRRALRVCAGDRRAWLATGLAVGIGLGLPLGARLLPDRTPPAAASAVLRPPSADGTECPWKYVVTDGVDDDVLVFDTPQRGSIIDRYAPRQVFYAPDPPIVVDRMMRTADGWVGQGDWIRRYPNGPCRKAAS